ncbi:hypothetical protein T4D_14408 [Trichinella pseudospiralis]|uniref:Uncharacterized protein n=1 Tax=Trichinella pseudospiralis TaxID=6337 RepID=A0A0V1G0E4_TRIPS|nr:hypothetical protein T4D_14408 [Trichinella pseudospiralis]
MQAVKLFMEIARHIKALHVHIRAVHVRCTTSWALQFEICSQLEIYEANFWLNDSSIGNFELENFF